MEAVEWNFQERGARPMTAKFAVTSGIFPFSHRGPTKTSSRCSILASDESKRQSIAFFGSALFRVLYATSWWPVPYRLKRTFPAGSVLLIMGWNLAAELPLSSLSPKLDKNLGEWIDPCTDFSRGLQIRIHRFDDPPSSFIRLHERKTLGLQVKREHVSFIGKVNS